MKYMRFLNMKPRSRFSLPCKNTPILGVPFPKSSNFSVSTTNLSNFHSSTHKFIDNSTSPGFSGFKSIFNQPQKSCSPIITFWGQSRILSTCNISKRPDYVFATLASDSKHYSTSVETRVNNKSFERIYVQGGVNVKPAVLEKVDLDENIMKKEDDKIEVVNHGRDVESESLNEVKVGREESEVEKEAWRLLRNAVVSYCGSPVGTLAANDPNDKLPLNYDQVSIRDFIPSAFAFLLKGEGEIVRNFLLHTLQLQVWDVLRSRHGRRM